MKSFRVYTDEKITVWQRVGLVIHAEDQNAAERLLSDPAAFQAAMAAGHIEYNGQVDPYWDTEYHADWEHDNADIETIGG